MTRGGSYFRFHGLGNINQYAFYVTDDIKLGNFSVNIGLRDDQYNGLVSKNGIQPRLGTLLSGESHRDGAYAPRIRVPSRRRSTKICCFRAQPAAAD